MNLAAEPGGRNLRGEPEPIPGQLVVPGMPPERQTEAGQGILPGARGLADSDWIWSDGRHGGHFGWRRADARRAVDA